MDKMAVYPVILSREIKKSLLQVAKRYGIPAAKLVQDVMNLVENIKGKPQKGVVCRTGYYSDSDGVFLEQTSDGLFLVLRSSTSGSIVDTRITEIQGEDHLPR